MNILTLLLNLAFTCAVIASPVVSEAKPYSGQRLRVLAFKDGHTAAVAKKKKEFERISGAKVVFDTVAPNSVASKIGNDQTAGGTYDLYAVDELFMPKLSSFFVSLDDWPLSRIFPATETSLDNFLPAALQAGGYRGTNFGIPITGSVYMYLYRRDLFADTKEQTAFKKKYGYNLDAPATMTQMRDIAEFFTRPPNLYGFAPFTRISEGTTVEAIWILSSFGVEILDNDLRLLLDEKKAAEALDFYKTLMSFAPPGATNWHNKERMGSYAKGQLAQIMTWPSFLADLENPKKSLVVGKTTAAIPPAGRKGQPAPVAGTWTVAIPKTTKVKHLAADFARWWSSYSTGQTLIAAGMNPARTNLLADPKLSKKNPWFPEILANFEKAVVRPRFSEYKRVSDVISRHFTAVISGVETPAVAAQGIKTDITKILKDAGIP